MKGREDTNGEAPRHRSERKRLRSILGRRGDEVMKNKQQESVKREGDKEEIVMKKEKRAVSSATSVFLTLKMKTTKNVLGKMRKLMAM